MAWIFQSAAVSSASFSTGSLPTVVFGASGERKGITVMNLGSNAFNLQFGHAVTASVCNVSVPGGALYEMTVPVYTGVIYGFFPAGSGSVVVTEFT